MNKVVSGEGSGEREGEEHLQAEEQPESTEHLACSRNCEETHMGEWKEHRGVTGELVTDAQGEGG